MSLHSSALRFSDPTANSDAVDCCLLKQITDSSGAIATYRRMTCDLLQANTCSHMNSRPWAIQDLPPATLHEWPPKSLRPAASWQRSPVRTTTLSIALTWHVCPPLCPQSQGTPGSSRSQNNADHRLPVKYSRTSHAQGTGTLLRRGRHKDILSSLARPRIGVRPANRQRPHEDLIFEVNLHVIPDHPNHLHLLQDPTTAQEDRKH